MLEETTAGDPISLLKWTGMSKQLGPSHFGQPNVPFAKRFAETHSPQPSKKSSFSRLRCLLVNKKT
jgi:hypothetical protein